MKVKHLFMLVLLTAILFILQGCAKDAQLGKLKVGGDDQMLKAEQNVKTDEISAIKKAIADLKGQISAQMGFINKTMTDQSSKEAGGNIIQNNPEMINLFVIVFAITIGVPYLSILLIFYFYMRYNEKAQKRLVKQKENK